MLARLGWEIPFLKEKNLVGTRGIKTKTLTDQDDYVNVRCCIPDNNQLYPCNVMLTFVLLGELCFIELIQTSSCKWRWVKRGVLMCFSVYLWSRFLLVSVLKKIHLLVNSFMLGYLHRDICMYMLYQRRTFLFIKCYRIPNSYQLLPIFVVKHSNQGNTQEFPGNYLVITY